MECGYLYPTAQVTFSRTIPNIFTLGKSTSTRRADDYPAYIAWKEWHNNSIANSRNKVFNFTPITEDRIYISGPFSTTSKS
jgi:hypothetical protein